MKVLNAREAANLVADGATALAFVESARTGATTAVQPGLART